MGFRVASGHTERAHQPILPVRAVRKCREVQSLVMQEGNSLVRDVRGCGVIMVHGKEGYLT